MLTIDQKKAVYAAVLKTFTISTKSFTATTIYSNQTSSTQSYPQIILSYISEESKDQNSAGDFIGTSGSKGQRSLATLSINIIAKAAQSLNANTIAHDIARQLSTDIRTNWKSLSSGTVRFKWKTATRNLTAVEQAAGIFDTARYNFDCYLMYDLVW